MTIKKIFSFLFVTGVLVMYQNCGSQNVSFETLDGAVISSGTTDIDDADQFNSGTSGDNPFIDDDSESNIGNGQASGPIINDTNDGVTFEGCESYTEITGADVIIPAGTQAGVCYYKQLMSAIESHKSGSHGETRAMDVISRNHDGSGDISPYIIADTTTHFNIQGARRVALSSSYSNPKADMKIDNYFLIQLTDGTNSGAWAYGTKDALPQNNGGMISVNDIAIDNFYDFANGGTATVTALDFTSSVPVNANLSLRFRALDCGGAAAGSDVFIVFY